jgi:PAS domain-containing protein
MTLIQNTPAAYAVLSKDYKVMFLNDFFMRARNWEGPVPVGETCYNTINNGVICPQCAVREAIESGRPARMLRKDVMADGNATYSDDFGIPIVDPETGEFDCILQVIVSRTEEMRLQEHNNGVFLEIVHSLVSLLEKKYPYTSVHCRNVGTISAKLAQHMGLGSRAVFRAALGGLLHDLGMLYVPSIILEKDMGLSEEEYATVKEHPMFAQILLAGLPSFNDLKDVATAHHEMWNGRGYPRGTSGEAIPIEARIIAIADTYDAMTSDRPYRAALPHSAVIAEIGRLSGSRFDPRLAEGFAWMVENGGMDKAALVAPAGRPSAPTAEFTLYEHHAKRFGPAPVHAGARSLEEVMASDTFLESIFDNTPAFYTVVDESFNVIYASGSLAAAAGKSQGELLSGRCCDAMGQGMPCHQQGGAWPSWPAAKAFATGKREDALMEVMDEDMRGQRLYFDNFAVPIELDGADGGRIKCCLEIMFDRTKEKGVRNALEGDLKQLMAKIRSMVEDILPETSANVREIVREANSFGEYLENIKAGLSGLSGLA